MQRTKPTRRRIVAAYKVFGTTDECPTPEWVGRTDAQADALALALCLLDGREPRGQADGQTVFVPCPRYRETWIRPQYAYV